MRAICVRGLAILACACGVPGAADAGSAKAPAEKARHVTGIWKAAVPPGGMKGEFDNHDPIALANGARARTDCSLNWTDPDTRKLYCFNSATSQSYFQDWPKSNIVRAVRAWQRMQESRSSTN